jgi:hypothetical protein
MKPGKQLEANSSGLPAAFGMDVQPNLSLRA